MIYYSTKKTAEMLGVSERRIRAKIAQGHFPSAKKCGCERESWLISEIDVKKNMKNK